MNQKNCRHNHNQCNNQEFPCQSNQMEQCNQESEDKCTCENKIKICGRVTHINKCIENATVILKRNNQIVAKCTTDCYGRYDYTGPMEDYHMTAYKGNKRSITKRVLCVHGNEFEVNFNIR